MKWMSFLAASAILLTTLVYSAEEDAARTAVNQAFARQKALPGYVEHQFGRLPIEPRAAEVGERATAEQADAEPVIEMGPEQEIATIEHPETASATCWRMVEARSCAVTAGWPTNSPCLRR